MKKILFASVFALMAAVSNVTAQETTATTEATGTSASSTAAGSTIGGIATSTVVTGAVVVGVAAAIIANANDDDGPIDCPVGQQLINGECQDIVCPDGQQLDANGNCVPIPIICDDGTVVTDPSDCPQPPTCDPGEELVDGVCVPIVCPTGEQLNDEGVCEPIICDEGEVLVGNVCEPIVVTTTPTTVTGTTTVTVTTTK